MLSCGLLGRGPDGKCKDKPMKKGPPTSPLTVMPEKKKKEEKGVRVSPVSFQQQGGRRKTRRKKRKKKKRKTKKRRKRKKRKTKKRYRNQRGCKR